MNSSSELVSLPRNGESDLALEITKKENVYLAESKMKNPPVTAKHKSSTCRSGITRLKCCEVLIVTPVMLVIIGLLLLPTVFYALPSQQSTLFCEWYKLVFKADYSVFCRLTVVKVINKTESDCLKVDTYSGEVCRDALTSSQICFSGVESPPPALNIPSLIDQQTGERDATRLVNGLTFLSPSPQCGEAIMPFLCLSIFALCDSSNHLHTILRGDCLELKNDICAEEWSEAVGFLGAGVLPVCEDLPDTTDECIGSADNCSLQPTPFTNISHLDQSTLSPSNQTSSDDQLVCSDGFFFDENVTNLCRPSCGEFNPRPLSLQIVEKFAISTSFIVSVLMFLLVLTAQREKLYTTCIFFLTAGTLIVGFFDSVTLFCGSRDLLKTTREGNETPFCTISGFVFNYCLEQICMWAALHATFLFWAARYPISYRKLRISGRIRYAHIISVILAIVLPLLGPCILLRDGYTAIGTPPLLCAGRNFDLIYHAIILPVSFLVGITSCLLVLLFWTLFKEFVIKTKVGKVWKAQLKISSIIIYYTFVGVMGLVSYTYYRVNDSYQESLTDYVLCESGGQSDCVLDLDIGILDALSTTVTVMISSLPVLAILFSCDPQACRRKKATDLERSANVTFVRSTTSTSAML